MVFSCLVSECAWRQTLWKYKKFSLSTHCTMSCSTADKMQIYYHTQVNHIATKIKKKTLFKLFHFAVPNSSTRNQWKQIKNDEKRRNKNRKKLQQLRCIISRVWYFTFFMWFYFQIKYHIYVTQPHCVCILYVQVGIPCSSSIFLYSVVLCSKHKHFNMN